MFTKLAVRNVKRQVGNYLIYFITVSLTVALLFALNNVIFSEELLDYASGRKNLSSGLLALTIAIAVIVSFVLSYATSFMLKLRKREFGTYLTLGMTRGNILKLFISETTVLCLISLVTGTFLGIFIYQAVMKLISNLMEITYSFSGYSADGFALTVVLVFATFLLSSVTSAIYLKRVSIYRLLHADQMTEKKAKNPVLWGIITVLSLAGLIFSFKAISDSFHSVASDTTATGADGMLWLFTIAISDVFFHIGLARSLTAFFLKRKRFRSRGTNTFVLRTLSGTLSTNATLIGFISFLILFAIIGSNVCFIEKISSEARLNNFMPYGIHFTEEADKNYQFTDENAAPIIDRYTNITNTVIYPVYGTGDNTLHRATPWSGGGYTGLFDSLIAVSDYNRLITGIGAEPISLQPDSYHIVYNFANSDSYDFSTTELVLNGKTYTNQNQSEHRDMFSYHYFLAVVPDEAVAGLSITATEYFYAIENEHYNAYALYDELSYVHEDTYNNEAYSDYKFKEYYRLEQNENNAVLIMSMLYLSFVFVLLAMAILALKTLSGLSDDKVRYDILKRLGLDHVGQEKTLHRQILTFFLMPFALPILINPIAGYIIEDFMSAAGFANISKQILLTNLFVGLIVLAVYALYYIATYQIAKQNTLR